MLRRSLTAAASFSIILPALTVPVAAQAQSNPAPIARTQSAPVTGASPLPQGTVRKEVPAAELKRKFDGWDKNRDGFISAAEAPTVVRMNGQTRAVIREDGSFWVKTYDTNADGRVSRAEYEARSKYAVVWAGPGLPPPPPPGLKPR